MPNKTLKGDIPLGKAPGADKLTKKVKDQMEDNFQGEIRWRKSLGHPAIPDYANAFEFWVQISKNVSPTAPGAPTLPPVWISETGRPIPDLKASSDQDEFLVTWSTLLNDRELTESIPNTTQDERAYGLYRIWAKLKEDVPWLEEDGTPSSKSRKIEPEFSPPFARDGLLTVVGFTVVLA